MGADTLQLSLHWTGLLDKHTGQQEFKMFGIGVIAARLVKS
jgi:hypothetical protein